MEKIEKAKNSQLAREIEIALPIELKREQGISLVRRFVNDTFVTAGMCADVCIHDKNDGNPHAHIMLTMRPIEHGGEWGAKQKKEYILDPLGNKIYAPKKRQYKCKSIPVTDWNEQTKAEEWRKAWADAVNAALERNNHIARVDHRSYERQGNGIVPTVHMGVAATRMEKRGIRTERGDKNREAAITNRELSQLRARINKLKNWIYAQPLQDAPSMVELMNNIADNKNMKSRWKKIADLKTAAKVLVFLQKNNISGMEQLADVVTHIQQQRYDLANKIKAAERRIYKLNEHLEHVDKRKQHMATYKKYKQLDPKKQSAYAEKHAEEITAYETALRYFKDHLNGRNRIPEREWRAERKKLLAERYVLVEDYYRLKDDVRNMEVLQRNAVKLMGEVAAVRKVEREQDIAR